MYACCARSWVRSPGRLPFRKAAGWFLLLITTGVALLSAGGADAGDFGASFTVAGKVTAERRLDVASLDKLPQHAFMTNTPWTKEPHKYSGPLLRDVLAAVGASGTQLRATALNEYQITIPVDDALRHDVIVAHRIDDRLIPVRERGPFFIIYPFDADHRLQEGRYYERSIWQLKHLQVE